MRIVFIGDDFTGASDTLATLSERGLKVRLFLDVPHPDETRGLDAVGIATDLRSLGPGEIATRLMALLPAVQSLAPRFIHYKVCSTFDSAPHIGSIGSAVRTLERVLAPSRTFILGGQPSLGRYCLFGTLFARAPDGDIYRIDRHPVMNRHPVTPMDEADLRIHLAKQGLEDVGLLDRPSLTARSQDGLLSTCGRILVDAIDQSDIDHFGNLLSRLDGGGKPDLIVGASSVAEALISDGTSPREMGDAIRWPDGPILAVAGSRSAMTARQVDAAHSYQRVPVQPEDLAVPDRIANRCAHILGKKRNVMVHLQPDVDYARTPNELSGCLARLTKTILSQHRAVGLAVAGGDTSSTLVSELGFRSLSFIERAGAGVAVCLGHAADGPLDGTILLLKGGQVGDVDLFERFAKRFAR